MLQPLANSQMGVGDVRRSFFTWLRSMYAAAERDLEEPQRGPQNEDPPGQEIPSAVLTAMHENPALAEAAAPQERERSGIHEQAELPDADALTAIYGIGVQMVMRRGWKVHEGLGVRRSDEDRRLVAPLINERVMDSRTGIGWAPPQPPARSRSRLGSEASSSSHGPCLAGT